ncbi:MAG: hypothetical protein COB65_02385 [Thalassobium sp.]|nr:MAG: hypothetical protein COB65_02385 [Thalassobium sp.]
MTTYTSSFVSVTVKEDTGEVTDLIPGATVEIVYPDGQTTFSYTNEGLNPTGTGYYVLIDPFSINLTINGEDALEWDGGAGPEITMTTIYWNDGVARATQILAFYDIATDQAAVVIIGGDAIPNYSSLDEFGVWAATYGAYFGLPAAGSGFEPGDDIPILGGTYISATEDDFMNGTEFADTLSGGIGDDTVQGNGGNDSILGGLGDDLMTGGEGNDSFELGFGADTIDGGNGVDSVTAYLFGYTAGSILFNLGTGVHSWIGNSAESDTVTNVENYSMFGDLDLTVIGTAAANRFVSTGSGDTTLNGGLGNDLLVVSGGSNTLRGQGDEDTIYGGNGSDIIYGGSGNDVISGDDPSGASGGGDDLILGQGNDDSIDGGAGADSLFGGSGNDILKGGDGNDDLRGQGNNDTMYGGADDDKLFGAAGLDTLYGGDGNDSLFGGNGADVLNGGAGNDVMNGGNQPDTFIFEVGGGTDRINSYVTGSDTIQLDEDLWVGLLTQEQVVANFGSLNINGTILTLTFSGGEVLEIQSGAGINPSLIDDDISFI